MAYEANGCGFNSCQRYVEGECVRYTGYLENSSGESWGFESSAFLLVSRPLEGRDWRAKATKAVPAIQTSYGRYALCSRRLFSPLVLIEGRIIVDGVIGNTSVSGTEKSWFDSRFTSLEEIPIRAPLAQLVEAHGLGPCHVWVRIPWGAFGDGCRWCNWQHLCL